MGEKDDGGDSKASFTRRFTSYLERIFVAAWVKRNARIPLLISPTG